MAERLPSVKPRRLRGLAAAPATNLLPSGIRWPSLSSGQADMPAVLVGKALPVARHQGPRNSTGRRGLDACLPPRIGSRGLRSAGWAPASVTTRRRTRWSQTPRNSRLCSVRAVRALYLIHYLGFPQHASRWQAWCREHDLFPAGRCGSGFPRNRRRPAGRLVQ